MARTLLMTPTAIRDREYKRQKRAEYLQQQQQEAAAAISEEQRRTSPFTGPLEEKLDIEVVPPEEKVAPSLKERLFGKSDPRPVKKAPGRSKKAGSSSNLLTSVVPTILASFLATYVPHWLPSEYQACAPSIEEASAIFSPLLAIVGRRVELTGKASADVMDGLAAIAATMMFATRAYVVYVDVKKEKEAASHGQTFHHREREIFDPEESSTRTARSSPLESEIPIDRGGGDATAEESSSGNARSEAHQVADLLRRDRTGRIRLGLLAS